MEDSHDLVGIVDAFITLLRGDDRNGRQKVFSGAFQLLMYNPGGSKAPGKDQKIYYTGIREERVDQTD